MPSIAVRTVGLADPPPMKGERILHHFNGESLDLIVLNAGMASGQPSVMLTARTSKGLIVVETSLLALLAGARSAQLMAETRFGWEMPP
jgi:hypothetical protein